MLFCARGNLRRDEEGVRETAGLGLYMVRPRNCYEDLPARGSAQQGGSPESEPAAADRVPCLYLEDGRLAGLNHSEWIDLLVVPPSTHVDNGLENPVEMTVTLKLHL